MNISFNYDSGARAPKINEEAPTYSPFKPTTKKGRIHFFEYHNDLNGRHKDKYAVLAKKVSTPNLGFFEKKFYIIQKDPTKSETYYKINKASLHSRLGITSEELKNVKDGDFAPLIETKLQAKKESDPLFFTKYETKTNIASTQHDSYTWGKQAQEDVLPTNLKPRKYRQEINKAGRRIFNTTKKAEGGKTTVYLPKDMPEVVLKKSGKDGAMMRLHNMQVTREVLKDLNCTHLVIPQVNVHKKYLVETRVPISARSLDNIKTYLENPEKFDDAVREITKMYSVMHLSRIVDPRHLAISSIVGDSVRYDNLPLYIDTDGKGKIGLIDLERIYSEPGDLGELVRIFPLHRDIIIDESNKLREQGSHFRSDSPSKYEEEFERGKKYLEEAYSKHLAWSKDKHITPKTATQPFSISPERKQEIAQVVESEILKLNHRQYEVYERRKKEVPLDVQKDFLNNPEEAKQLAPAISEQILENVLHEIKSHLKEHTKKRIDSETKMLEVRAQVVETKNIINNVSLPQEVALNLAAAVLQELEKGGEIFSFGGDFQTYSQQKGWDDKVRDFDTNWAIRY